VVHFLLVFIYQPPGYLGLTSLVINQFSRIGNDRIPLGPSRCRAMALLAAARGLIYLRNRRQP
jgi:hypothetical protein